MTQLTPELREAVLALDPQDRLQLATELWDSLDADDVPISEAWKEELDRRKAALEANPSSGLTWEQLPTFASFRSACPKMSVRSSTRSPITWRFRRATWLPSNRRTQRWLLPK